MADARRDPQLTEMVHATMPFAQELGIVIESGSPSEVVARVGWSPRFCTVGDALHGGYLMAVADSVGALCAHLNLPEGATTATITSTTSFMHSVREQDMTFTATPVHAGRSTVVVQTDGYRADGTLAVRTTQTQTIAGPVG